MADFEQDLLDLASSKPKKKRTASAMNGGGVKKAAAAKRRKVEKSAERVQSDEEEKPVDPDETESEPAPSNKDEDETEDEDDEDADLESEDGAPAPQRRRELSIPLDIAAVPASGAAGTAGAGGQEEDEEEDMDIDMDIESEDGAPAPAAAVAARTSFSTGTTSKPNHLTSPAKPASALRTNSTSRPALNNRSSSGQQKAGGKAGAAKKGKTAATGKKTGSKKERELKEKYPLDGKYIDEDDREMIDNLPDLERDQILADRAEEVQRLLDAIALEQMYVERGGEASLHTGGGADSDAEDDDDDAELASRRGGKGKKGKSGKGRDRFEDEDVDGEDDDADGEVEDDEDEEELGRGAKRRSTKDEGQAKEREVLKQARKAKAERTAEKHAKQRRGSPTRRRHSDSEGSAAGYDERPRSNKKRYGKANSDSDDSANNSEDASRLKRGDDGRSGNRKSRTEAERERKEDPVRVEDLEGCKLSRYQLADMKHRDFFAELLIGSYVRGPAPPAPDSRAERKSRVYLVVGLEEPSSVAYTMEYKLKQIPENRRIRVKYGSFEQKIKMDGISNSPFTQEEFSRWKAMLGSDQEPLPLRSELKERRRIMQALMARPITEIEISRRIAAMYELGRPASATDTSQAVRIRLEAERGLAIRRHDARALEAVENELRALNAVAPLAKEDDDDPRAAYNGEGGMAELQLLARVNERNRRMAVESSRRAHLANLDRRRAMEAGKVMDSSARVKSKMKLHDSSAFSQKLSDDASTQIDITNAINAMSKSNGNGSPAPKAVLGKKGSVAVDLDLGDF